MKTLIAGWVILASMTLSIQGQEFNALSHKPLVSATSTPYLADPTGSNDATTAIQNCIKDTAQNNAICALPQGTYKISGSGLTMPNQSGLYGFQNIGVGTASLVYYGTGTAITIGNCSVPTPLVYGVNLVNIAINQADGTTAQYGIQACGLSEANWDGLSVGNGSRKGYFTGANIRFYESAEIDLLNLMVTNVGYQPRTTGILFDNVYMDPNGNPGGGNATITIHGGLSAIYGFQNAIVCKSCVNITVRDALLEANDYGLFVDNSTWSSPYDALDNVHFEGTEFLMDPQYGPTHNKVLQVNSPSGAKLVVKNLVFRSTKWQLSGSSGVTFPVELNIPSTGPYSVVSLKLDTNSIAGANTAVVDSDNVLASIVFTGANDITDPSGVTRPADVHGTATVTDYARPIAVNVLVEAGADNALVTGPAISNPDLGFGLVVTVPLLAHTLRAGGNTFTYELPISSCTQANPMVCTSISAPASGTTVLISGLMGAWGPGDGTYTATNLSGTTFSVPFNSQGLPPFTANNPGWGNVLPIKSSFDPNADIAKGYARNGAIVLFYTSKAWLDLKQ